LVIKEKSGINLVFLGCFTAIIIIFFGSNVNFCAY